MKKLLLLCVLGLTFCADDGKNGVNQAFITEQFLLSDASNPTVLDVDETDDCPRLEMDSGNKKTFQIRFAGTNPPEEQTTFAYADDVYKEDGEKRILKGINETNTTFEITFDGNEIYTILVDFNCANAGDPDCSTTTFECSGVLVIDAI